MGASVVITGRDTKRIDAVIARCLNNSSSQPATDITKQHDGDHHRRRHQKAIGVKADLSLDTDINLLIERVSAEFGGQLDILVNNAGGSTVASFVDANCINLLDQELKILRGHQLLTKLLIPLLTASTRGSSIVNVSATTERPSYEVLANMLCKSSLDMFTKCLALELAPKGVRVNCVGAGTILTPMVLNNPVYNRLVFSAEFLQTIPLGRPATADEVVNAIVFLAVTPTCAVSGGSFVNGIKLNVTGGQFL
ncbi:17-beta-hydroxysteroid dehydrogenase 14-like [Oppia nitens]|uniref:17-beta-hydroxysteroid dehydrogenase 14-like n=1 Tax=Oppia nitens TaxID=1686743 RepID=UPI0023DB4101|nr:17-beta-hydroxysteroid dehydrogenase 14-like [Oppia nitens]